MSYSVENFLDLAQASYARKWIALSILIGIAAGLGSIVFYWSLATATKLLLGHVAGYVPPTSTGEGLTVFTRVARPWVLPLLTAAGGLLSGLLVYRFAPEAEGHGTDAAIDAFHNKGGAIRRRVPVVKAIASAITIGSGGGGGVFAPGLVIGGMVGGSLWSLLSGFPAITPSSPSGFVIVGMMALFGGIAKVPLAVIIMVSEMTMDYTLLIPSMLACSIAYFVT